MVFGQPGFRKRRRGAPAGQAAGRGSAVCPLAVFGFGP